MTYCPHCGTKLGEVVDAFCPECRGDLTESPPVASPPPSTRRPNSIIGRAVRSTPVQWAAVAALVGLIRGVHTLSQQGKGGNDALSDAANAVGYLLGSAVCPGVGFFFGYVTYRVLRWLRPPKDSALRRAHG